MSRRRDYTPSQSQMMLQEMSKARSSNKPGAVSRTVARLAKKLKRTPRAIEAKVGRLTGQWNS